jgi:diguanylate cyclase (GGDEF)-like protein/PAS domain S-box-containing protein
MTISRSDPDKGQIADPELEIASDVLLIADAGGRIVSRSGSAPHIPSEETLGGTMVDLLQGITSATHLVHDLTAIPKEASLANRLIPLDDGGVLLLSSTPLPDGGRVWLLRDVSEVIRSQELRVALFRIAEITRSARDLQELYGEIQRLVGSLMNAENFYIAVYDKESSLLHFPYFVDRVDPQPPALQPGKGLTAYVLRTGEPLLVTPEEFREMVQRGEVEETGTECVDWLGVPLRMGTETIGVLGVQSYDESIRYTAEHLQILVFVSQHVASAIQHWRNEEALRESERRYRQMFDNNRAVKLVIDPISQQIVDVNKAACEFYGYTRRQLCSMKISDINTLPSEKIQGEIDRAVERHSSYFEFRHRLASGEIRDVEVYSGPFELEGRTYLYSIISDVTEKTRAEALLRTQAAAIESSMDGIAVMNPDGRIAYVNDAFKKLYGYGENELVGLDWLALHEAEEGDHLEESILSRLEHLGQWAGEATGKRRNGVFFPEEISVTRLEDGSFVCVVRDVTERTQAEEQIRHLAYHDPLTELPNRLLLRDRINVALSQAERQRAKLAVLFLDLDRFKIINDSLGHDTGDALLQAVADRLRNSVRDSDTVARLGGDEFTILLPAIRSDEDAIHIARKILDSIRQPFLIHGRELYVTTSIGVSLYPEDGDRADILLKNADTAMYQAKELGRNNIQPFNAVVNVRTLERLALENGLRRGLAQDEFELYYQPIFELSSGKLHGVEALLRWNHPDAGVILPANFIGLAEETGLMIPLGKWVLEKATAQAVEWHRAGFNDISVAVNVSASQVQKSDFIDSVREAIELSGIDPTLLEIEITESYAMEDPEKSVETLEELKSLGVCISVDDFGTGYSSLSYLKRFPIDTLKIDASFIRDMTLDIDTAEIVNAIIAMGHNLRLEVVAEGVEQDSHRDHLLESRCDRVQGHLYSPPLQNEALGTLLREHGSRTKQWETRAASGLELGARE